MQSMQSVYVLYSVLRTAATQSRGDEIEADSGCYPTPSVNPKYRKAEQTE